MEAWAGFIAAIAGVVLGWGLNQASTCITDHKKQRKELNVAAFACLDRLLKIRSALTSSDVKRTDDEVYLLGGDLDRYRDCIAAASNNVARRHHLIYRKLMLILRDHDFEVLDQVITELETVVGM